jgi:hypothetical protein
LAQPKEWLKGRPMKFSCLVWSSGYEKNRERDPLDFCGLVWPSMREVGKRRRKRDQLKSSSLVWPAANVLKFSSWVWPAEKQWVRSL